MIIFGTIAGIFAVLVDYYPFHLLLITRLATLVKWLMLRLLLLVPCRVTCAVMFLDEVWFIWASTPCCMKLIEENKNIAINDPDMHFFDFLLMQYFYT